MKQKTAENCSGDSFTKLQREKEKEKEKKGVNDHLIGHKYQDRHTKRGEDPV